MKYEDWIKYERVRLAVKEQIAEKQAAGETQKTPENKSQGFLVSKKSELANALPC